jgi:pimeloyl-ACP methyl ester carboxylesterase
LRQHQPATLVIWGKYDPHSWLPRGPLTDESCRRPRFILDAGHFASYEQPDEIARLISDFLNRSIETDRRRQ